MLLPVVDREQRLQRHGKDAGCVFTEVFTVTQSDARTRLRSHRQDGARAASSNQAVEVRRVWDRADARGAGAYPRRCRIYAIQPMALRSVSLPIPAGWPDTLSSARRDGSVPPPSRGGAWQWLWRVRPCGGKASRRRCHLHRLSSVAAATGAQRSAQRGDCERSRASPRVGGCRSGGLCERPTGGAIATAHRHDHRLGHHRICADA